MLSNKYYQTVVVLLPAMNGILLSLIKFLITLIQFNKFQINLIILIKSAQSPWNGIEMNVPGN